MTVPQDHIAYQGRFLQFVNRGRWEFVQRRGVSGVVVIVATTAADEIVLVEQLRPPLGTTVVELPAGLAGDIAGLEDEDLSCAASRELLEETGYRCRPEQLRRCFSGPTSAGLTDETATFFVVRGVQREQAGGGDGSEDITVHPVPLAEVHAWLQSRIAAGQPIDPKVYTGLYLLSR